MSKAITLDGSFVANGDVDLPTKFDGISEHNMYLYIKSYLSHLRTNAANVKTRAAVSGGGKKPWNQKGGGRARAGSITSPVFVGGGVAHGPSGNRNYNVRINKKQKILALEYALKHKADASKLYVVDRIVVDSGKTRDALSIFNNLRERDALFVVKSYDERTFLAFRNIRSCCLVDTGEFNAYLVAVFRSVVMERAVFDEIIERG